jgi:hypothetical protein
VSEISGLTATFSWKEMIGLAEWPSSNALVCMAGGPNFIIKNLEHD